MAALEIADDPSIVKNLPLLCGSAATNQVQCNFGIASPNASLTDGW